MTLILRKHDDEGCGRRWTCPTRGDHHTCDFHSPEACYCGCGPTATPEGSCDCDDCYYAPRTGDTT